MLSLLTPDELNDLRAAIEQQYSEPINRFRAVTLDPAGNLLVVFEADRGGVSDRLACVFAEEMQFHHLATVGNSPHQSFADSPEPIQASGELLDDTEWDALTTITDDDIQDALDTLANGDS